MSLEDTLANVSLYDAKKYFRKAQNVVFNYTEMEAKVREATNNEPWGASSTLMEHIAQGTYNLREREEILGMIFRRFTEKTANEWRQIYKALQLLDYLIRHGSERFIDDTRCSMSLIKMLETFHYVDSQGKDQGANVRSRAQALSELLRDDDRIRAERKKARETSKKYKGLAGGSAAGIGNGAFLTGRNQGISISADYDTDDDEDDDEDDNIYGLVDPVPESLSPKPVEEDLIDEMQEEDIEFGEFQYAPPVTENSIGTVKDTFGSFTSNASPVTIPVVTPAVTTEQKKPDPFSSLFSSAKEDTVSQSKPIHSKPTSDSKLNSQTQEVLSDSTTKKETPGNDNDIFGELKAVPNTKNDESKQNVTADHAEVDLLSF